MEPTLINRNINEELNRLKEVSNKKDKINAELLQEIETSIEAINTNSLEDNYKILVGVEYLFVKLRVSVEFEQIKIKNLLTQDIQALFKSYLMKRDAYLTSFSLKLNTIREDIAVVQKVVYLKQLKNY